MRKLGSIFVCAALAGHAFIVKAADSHLDVLEPRAPWNLDFGDERCRLTRTFGQDGDMRLDIDAFGSNAATTFTLSGKLVPDGVQGVLQIRLAFSPDTVAREPFGVMAGELRDEPSIAFPARFTPDAEAFRRTFAGQNGSPPFTSEAFDRLVDVYTDKVDDMTVEFPGQERRVLLKTGNMTEPMAALRGCVNDLIKTWGLDPAKYRTESRRAGRLPTARPLSVNFPRDIAYSGLHSLLPIRVMIDERGRAVSCVVRIASMDRRYKDSICGNFAGVYQPALDDAGKPRASFYQPVVIYSVPGREWARQ